MRAADKRKVREEYARRRIDKQVVIEKKLLTKQIMTLSQLTRIANDDIGDSLVGANQILELFEWLPKGEYNINVKIV